MDNVYCFFADVIIRSRIQNRNIRLFTTLKFVVKGKVQYVGNSTDPKISKLLLYTNIQMPYFRYCG